MLRLIPKNQEKRQVPPELASLGLPDRLLELLLDRRIIRREETACGHDLQKIRAVFYLFPHGIDKIVLSGTQSQAFLLKLLG